MYALMLAFLQCCTCLTLSLYADIKMEIHPRPNSAEQQSVVSSQQHHIPLIGAQTFPLITSIPAPVSLSTSLSSVPTTFNPLTSSSIRLGQMPTLQLKGQSSDATAAMDRDALAKAELRRARRSAVCFPTPYMHCSELQLVMCLAASASSPRPFHAPALGFVPACGA